MLNRCPWMLNCQWMFFKLMVISSSLCKHLMFAMFETKLSWESPMSWLVHTHSRGCRGTSRCCKLFLCSVVISGEKPLQSRVFRCQVFLLGGSLEIKGLFFRYSSYSCPLPLYTHAWSIPPAVNSTDPWTVWLWLTCDSFETRVLQAGAW